MNRPPAWVRLIATSVTVWAVLSGVSAQLRSNAVAYSANADVLRLDPFAATAHDVSRLHRTGRTVACRLSVGVWEPGRPDAGRFDPVVLGSTIVGPTVASDGRRWLDVRRWDLIGPVLADRLALCRAKGFDAVATEDADGYAHVTGFTLRVEDQRVFNRAFEAAADRTELRLVIGS